MYDDPDLDRSRQGVGEVLPELKGKLDGSAIPRAHSLNVSAVDLTFVAGKRCQRHGGETPSVAEAGKRADEAFGMILRPKVSIDFNHTARKPILRRTKPRSSAERWCGFLAWYDLNGLFLRMADVAALMGRLA